MDNKTRGPEAARSHLTRLKQRAPFTFDYKRIYSKNKVVPATEGLERLEVVMAEPDFE